MSLRYLPGDPDGAVEVAFAIGRSVGNAVTRNRLRRRLRAHLHELDRQHRVPPGVYLVRAAPEAAELDFATLGHHLGRALARLEGPGS